MEQQKKHPNRRVKGKEGKSKIYDIYTIAINFWHNCIASSESVARVRADNKISACIFIIKITARGNCFVCMQVVKYTQKSHPLAFSDATHSQIPYAPLKYSACLKC